MIPSMNWQSLSLQLVTSLAHFLWQGALIGAALTVLLRFCSSRSANTRYIIASVAFALLPLSVAATFAVVHFASDPIFIAQASTENAASTRVRSSVSAEQPETGIVDTAIPGDRTESRWQAQVATAAAITAAAKSPWSSWLSTASPYVVVVYFAGVAVSLLRLGSSIWTSGSLRRAAKKIDDSAITRIVAAQASRLGLKRIPLFALCEQISVPVVAGILKPTILLPPAILCGLDPQQLAAILSHEMAHIRRYDLLVNLLQRIVEALLFFHPVIWWISRQMSAEREDCCDDLAVAGSGRLVFASALLHMAELCAKNRGLAIGLQLEAMAADGGNQSQLTRRIHRLLGEVDAPRFVFSRMSVVVAFTATLMLAASLLAFAQTETNQSDETSNANHETPEYDASKFARAPERYMHLVYDQSLPDPARGLKSARVVQPLPSAGEAVRPATPFSENELTAESRHRIRSAYPTYRPGESIEVKDNTVLLQNAQAGTEQALVRGLFRADNFSRILARVAVSPDRKRVAAAVLMAGNGGAMGSDPLFDLYVIEVSGDERRSKVIRNEVHCGAIMGGAFLPAAVAPPIFWSDNDNLLIVTPRLTEHEGPVAWVDLAPSSEPTATELAELGNVLLVRDGEVLTATHDLMRINVVENSTHMVCELKLGNFMGGQQTSTDFWRRSDGAIMLRSRGTDTRIDLAKSVAVADRHLSPQYELRGDLYQPSLWYGDEQLAEVVDFRNVGVSPDGRSIAWYTRTNPRDTSNLGNTSQFPTTLWFHSPSTGTKKLAEGNFAWDNYWDVFENPILRPRFHWLTQDDFVARAGAADESTQRN